MYRGVLKAASTLRLDLRNKWSKEDTAALMTVLHQSWKPSSQSLCSAEQNNVELGHSISSSSSSKHQELDLYSAHCSRQCLSLVPNGSTHLHLG
jgi:hypothetical protein